MRVNLIRLCYGILLIIFGCLIRAFPGIAWQNKDFPLLGGLITFVLGIVMAGLSFEIKNS